MVNFVVILILTARALSDDFYDSILYCFNSGFLSHFFVLFIIFTQSGSLSIYVTSISSRFSSLRPPQVCCMSHYPSLYTKYDCCWKIHVKLHESFACCCFSEFSLEIILDIVLWESMKDTRLCIYALFWFWLNK
ncbi:hypothetical protein Ddye_013701 [Dipteronia dyeriana]|uniref:Uncharacterized protein n=1 Tax=Dipteronia dyeriana TaxID=168575 RepID=A0AAE0CJW6_9ROSI|nr:hypothetical protein Ddye_013701 [Dipteronia dyeriana]